MPKESVNSFVIDKRVVERNIKKGLITREAYDKHIASLSDVAAQAEKIQARLGDEEDAEQEDDSES